MGSPHLHCPGLHAVGYLVCNLTVYLLSVIHGINYRLVSLRRKITLHLWHIKNILGKEFRNRTFLFIKSRSLVSGKLIQGPYPYI